MIPSHKSMNLSLVTAFQKLDLPEGTDLTAVRKRCLQLCEDCRTEQPKLEEICSAYKRITKPGSGDLISLDQNEVKQIVDILRNTEKASDRVKMKDLNTDDSTKAENVSRAQHADKKQSNGLEAELLAEEARKKAQADKRKAKKKKRRDKKKTGKENGTADLENSDNSATDGSSDESGIDPAAAFVKNSKKKVADAPLSKPPKYKTVDTTNQKNMSQTTTNHDPHAPPSTADNTSITIKSQKLAIQGNKMAHEADFPQAIKLFSDAIKLEPTDYRFYGNRSFCYDKTMQYKSALQDAEKCIQLAPEWPKGYFRKGRALGGLRQYSDAEKSFQKVLKLDKNCEEATKELWRVRTRYLLDLGFSQTQSEAAAIKHSSLRQAVDSLLASNPASGGDFNDIVYHSDEDADFTTISQSAPKAKSSQATVKQASKPVAAKPASRPVASASATNDFTVTGSTRKSARPAELSTETKKMDPANPEGLTALWVGNVLPTVTEVQLQKLFSKYGHVSSVRCLPEKFCAFVNFYSKTAAGKAMNALQSHLVEGQHLLIKFPDNPVSSTSVLTKVKPTVGAPGAPRYSQTPQSRSSGPVKGNECYFWRTTGCQFGPRCRWLHLPAHEGIDKKSWQHAN